MPTCALCGRAFPNTMQIDGRVRVLNRRRYCVECSPFGGRNTRRLHLTPRVPRACAGCGKETANAKFCSNQCQRDSDWARMKVEIERTGVIPIPVSGNPAWAKRYLRDTRGLRCEVCGGTEWMGRPMPLELDHVNGDAGDWRVANLRLVCGNCDMQLPTYKSKNRGNGRAWRRKRYAEGRSY